MVTPSKEAMDAALNCVAKILNTNPDNWTSRSLTDLIADHFADVIRKAKAMDELERLVREHGADASPVELDLIRGKFCVTVHCDETELYGDETAALPAAIESLAAKIGGKP